MNKKASYTLMLQIAAVLILWGVVPVLAKLSSVPGDVITFFVNWTAVLAIATIISFLRLWKRVLSYQPRDYLNMVLLGLVWPLLYSITYFESINQGSPALTTILNYAWPAFYMFWAWLLNGRKFTRAAVLSIALSICAIAITQILASSEKDIAFAASPIILGLVAAASQGFYSAVTDEKVSYDPWVMTFIVEVVTAIGVSVVVAVRQSSLNVSTESLLYLSVIGVLSNGIGFWAFLASSKLSAQLGPFWKNIWLVSMCLVPVMQVVFLPFGGVKVSPYNIFGVIIVVVAMLFYRLSDSNKT